MKRRIEGDKVIGEIEMAPIYRLWGALYAVYVPLPDPEAASLFDDLNDLYKAVEDVLYAAGINPPKWPKEEEQ